jgi:hypothetical protein
MPSMMTDDELDEMARRLKLGPYAPEGEKMTLAELRKYFAS